MKASTPAEYALNLHPWPFATVDSDGCLTFANAAFSRWFGAAPGDHIDHVLSAQPQLIQGLEAARAGQSPGPIQTANARDHVTYRICFTPLALPDERSGVALYAQPTESGPDSARAARIAILDEALDRITRVPYSTNEPRETLDRIVELIAECGVADSAVMYVNHNGRWFIRHASGPMKHLVGSEVTEREVRPSLKALKEERVIVVNELASADDDTRRWLAQCRICAMMDVKIDVPWGDLVDLAIHYHSPPKRPFGDEDEVFLERVASRITMALHNAGLVAKLKHEQSELDSILKYIPVGVFVLDADLKLTRANESFETLFGIDAARAYGNTLEQFIPPPLGPRMFRHCQQARKSNVPLHFEEVLRLPDGGCREFATIKAALRDAEGRPTGVVAITADITERNRLQEELRRSHASLEQRVSERTEELNKTIAELERFTYTIAHDLRAPLRGIHRHCEMLLEPHGDMPAPAAQSHLRKVMKAARRMDQMIGDLLTYSRVGLSHHEPEPVDVGKVVQETVTALAEQIEARGADVKISGPFPRVLGDRMLLGQLLVNLLCNALTFVPPERAPQIEIGSTRRQRTVQLWIQDNGIGIDPRYRRRLFRLFERLHGQDEYPGSGIGLAIVKRAAERMRGRAGFNSELGKGSRFWVELRLPEQQL